MSVPLRIVAKPPSGEREAGMMWRYPPGDERTPYLVNGRPYRPCWWIVLPMTHPDIGTPGHPSQLSWRTTDKASDPPHEMWNVLGEPPKITVTPSIDVKRYVPGPLDAAGKPTWVRDGSYWHGYITNGEIVG